MARKSARARTKFSDQRPTQRRRDHTDSAALAKELGINVNKGISKQTFLDLMDGTGMLDHWQNRQTGLGIRGQDKRMSGGVGTTIPFREYEVEEILTADPIARRLVELPVKDSLRKGFALTLADEKQIKKINDELARIQAIFQMKMAGFYARTYGGAGLLMSVDDGLDPSQPLDLRRIRRFNGLIPLTRWELWTQFNDLETNINNPNFNFPKRYYLQPRRGLPFQYENVSAASPMTGLVENEGTKIKTLAYNTQIHSSRIIRFDGKWLPVRKRATNVYWDDSIFTSLWEAMRDFAESHGYLSTIVADFSLAVMKMKSAAALLSGEGNDNQITNMLSNMALFRNVMGAVLLGADDTYEWQSRPVTGLPDVVKEINLRFQACTDIPATILFNTSPSGMNATGDHEMNQWYNEVAWFQKDYWTPKFNRLFEVMLSAKFGPTQGVIPPDFSYEWLPLEQVNEKDEAAARYQVAQTDNIYNDMSGGTIAEEILTQRFGADRYNKNLKLKDVTIKEPEPVDPAKPKENTDAFEVFLEKLKLAEKNRGVKVDHAIVEKELIAMDATDFEERLPAKYLDVAPPGWSEKKMMGLKKAKGVENAFALAWWMHGQGYDAGDE